ncbi:MAG: endonuclease domain-containing protein [Planctomycetaceae bacterium]|nr:endonuclease domain-containing protein [Planctomycetaceae bacterium]
MRRKRRGESLERARELRREMTGPERVLWKVLRDRRLAGLKFRRQVPIESFIADFACTEQRLIIELDGESHADRFEYDRRREMVLKSAGWRVCRVGNDDVLKNLEGVLLRIVAASGLDPEVWRTGGYGMLPEGSF